MDHRDISVPQSMQGLPLFHGLPIPYATFIGHDGLPDFKVVDEKLRRRCMTMELCALCGKPLTKRLIVLIGGPKCVQSRTFFDPALHQECAIYATKVCPYLSDANWEYAKQAPRHLEEGQSVIKIHENIDNRRPARIALYYCRSYEMVKKRDIWFVKAGRAFKIDWDACGSQAPTFEQSEKVQSVSEQREK